MSTHPLKDFYTTGITKDNKHIISFNGVLCYCKCGGVASISRSGKTIDDPDLAYQIALIKHGYYLNFCDSSLPFKCECKAKYLAAKKEIDTLLIIEDSGWRMTGNSRPSTGYYDYKRTVKFAWPPTKDQLVAFKFVAFHDGPGYQSFGTTEVSETVFSFETSVDSGD